MTNPNEHIKIISGKVHQLLRQMEQLQKENEKNKALISDLEKQHTEQEAIIRDLHQQNLVLKASLQSLEPGEKKELEQKLTQYIKNIDKSISLLSQ
jgi:hypothetical protein